MLAVYSIFDKLLIRATSFSFNTIFCSKNSCFTLKGFVVEIYNFDIQSRAKVNSEE